MKTLMRLLVVAVLAVMATGCAVKVRGGTLYPFGVPPSVLVTNAADAACELSANGGRRLTILDQGDQYLVRLSYVVNSNQVITCKAYEYGPNGEMYYVGIAQGDFVHNSGGRDVQEWTIYNFRQPYATSRPVRSAPVRRRR